MWIDTRDGSVPFTGYSIGTSPDDKHRIAATVKAFVHGGAATCDATQDERLVFSLLSAGLAGVGLIALAFGVLR